MKIYTRRNAAVGYLTLKAVQRAIDKKRAQRRRNGLKVAAYVGLGIVHSVWQATVNVVNVRFLLFLLSTLALIWLAWMARRVRRDELQRLQAKA